MYYLEFFTSVRILSTPCRAFLSSNHIILCQVNGIFKRQSNNWRSEWDTENLHRRAIFHIVHRRPRPGHFGACQSLQFGFRRQQCIAYDFMHLFSAQHEAILSSKAMLKNFHLTNSPFLPLRCTRSESVELGSSTKHWLWDENTSKSFIWEEPKKFLVL